MLVYLVEDDPDYAEIIAETVRHDAHEVHIQRTLQGARDSLREHEPALAILDVLLPDGSGLALAREMREAGATTPILMLTSLDRVDDVWAGLEAGADDYLTKPFHPRELLGRVRALLRRAGTNTEPNGAASAEETDGMLRFDPECGLLTFRGQAIELTELETRILTELARAPEQVLTYTYLNSHVWNYPNLPDATLLKGHISSIRRKLRDAGCADDPIRTIGGTGYAYLPSAPA